MYSPIIHLIFGIGIGLLIFESLGSYQTLIGWLLLGIGVLGHILLWKRGEM